MKFLISGWERLRLGVPDGFLRNVAWQYVSSLWAGVATFAYGLLLGRCLGAGAYGLIAMGMAFAQVFAQIFELRLQEAVVKYVALFWERGQKGRAVAVVKLSLSLNVASTILALAVTLAAYPLAPEELRKDPDGFLILLLTTLTTLTTYFAQASCQGLLRVLGQFRAQAVVQILANTLRLVLTALLIFEFGVGILGVLLLSMLLTAGASLATAWLTYKALRDTVSPRAMATPVSVLRRHFPSMAAFVRSTYFLSLSMIPTRDLDVNLLGYFISKEMIGVYRMAKNFMAAIWILSDAAFLAIYPELARLWSRGEQSKLWPFVKRVVVVMGALGLFLYVAGCLTVPVFVGCVLGPAYSETGWLFALMGWGLLFWAPMIWANPLLMAAGRPDLVLRASVIGSLLMLCVNLYTIPRWGAAGSAFTFALANPVVMGLVLFYGWSSQIFRFNAGRAHP